MDSVPRVCIERGAEFVTNADRVRQMTNAELCEMMMYGRAYCKMENPLECNSAGMFKGGKYKSGCYLCIEKWLKQEVEDD